MVLRDSHFSKLRAPHLHWLATMLNFLPQIKQVTIILRYNRSYQRVNCRPPKKEAIQPEPGESKLRERSVLVQSNLFVSRVDQRSVITGFSASMVSSVLAVQHRFF